MSRMVIARDCTGTLRFSIDKIPYKKLCMNVVPIITGVTLLGTTRSRIRTRRSPNKTCVAADVKVPTGGGRIYRIQSLGIKCFST